MSNTDSVVPYVNLQEQWLAERDFLLPIIEEVLSSGSLIGGDAVLAFEEKLSRFCGVEHCVALNSGTDALVCGLHALGIGQGDEVITPPNSFVASTSSIVHVGATPVFVDVTEDQSIDTDKIEAAITKNTRAIMPVHLTGRVNGMDKIKKIADQYNLKVIEDAAQSIGSKFDGQSSGTIGDIGCFSAHPLKNLNACGDAGYLITDDFDIARKVRLMRNHGMLDRNTVEFFGHVSRMDTMQAAILSARLDRLDALIDKRRANAKLYDRFLDDAHIFYPKRSERIFDTFHTYVIQVSKRDELAKFLQNRGIQTAIHYPVPIHLQPAAKKFNKPRGSFPVAETQAEKILSLPINQTLSDLQIEFVAREINSFFGAKK